MENFATAAGSAQTQLNFTMKRRILPLQCNGIKQIGRIIYRCDFKRISLREHLVRIPVWFQFTYFYLQHTDNSSLMVPLERYVEVSQSLLEIHQFGVSYLNSK